MDRYLGQHHQPVCDALTGQAVDQATTEYVLEMRRAFEDLRQVAAQLAGLLVLAASGSQCAGPHHPMLTSAAQLHQEAVDAVRHARVPPGAHRHHQHLLGAAEFLHRALRAAGSGISIDPVLIPLRTAYDNLQKASAGLPGFSMVTFELGCCGRPPGSDAV